MPDSPIFAAGYFASNQNLKSRDGIAPRLLFSSNSHYKNRFFESKPKASYQKTDFVVFCTIGAENNKIGFIMRITSFWVLDPNQASDSYIKYKTRSIYEYPHWQWL
ncbi:MAG: hypothetical protein DCF19_18115 [Pseudanabaena frigida]|uniref:Uncharacterized protein n=1 Tax=Pseudanabaena frigida TaxID=945775 RepID=A0A2W4W0K3_9CYAN|nr:MAG: hypothetical protein DCF19_18115 [Pseudanabaena frigida]